MTSLTDIADPRFRKPLPRATLATLAALAALATLAVQSACPASSASAFQQNPANIAGPRAGAGHGAGAGDGSEEPVLPDYRPSKGARLGSLASQDFRRRAQAAVWSATIGAPREECLRSFLSPRVSAGESPGQLVISTPGSTLPESPLTASQAADLLSDKGLTDQVCSQLLPPGAALSAPPESTIACAAELEADPELREQVSEWISPLDYPPAVLSVLCELRSSVPPREWKANRRLALAIALVHDQKPPVDWPHGQVPPSCLPRGEMTPPEKFRDLISAHASGQLKLDPSQLSVGDLMHLVDHRLPASELAWLRKKYATVPLDKLAGRAYSDISYDKERESAGRYQWPAAEPYTMANISRLGGICVDQAFYSSMACKALGIPSAAFSGAGDDGGHAWVAFLSPSGWDFTVGRPEGKYIVGRSASPQSWVQTTDHDMEGEATVPPAARTEMWLARIFASRGDLARAVSAADAAASMAPSSVPIWRERMAILSSGEDPDGLRGRLASELRRSKMPASVKSETRMALAKLEMSRGNSSAARRQDIAAEKDTPSDRADLGVEQMAAAVRREIEAGRPDRAVLEYRKSVSSLQEGSRGEYFYAVVVPLVNSLVTGGSRPQAIQVAKLARRYLSPEKNSLLDRELSDLEKRAYRAGPPQARGKNGN